MNEGCATFVHYTIMNTLFDQGRISEGAMLEILRNHSNVVFQPAFDDPRYSGINPYALGFAMMQDIQRISMEPTAEDRDWFPDIAGNGDWRETLLDAWANHRDESFIRQYLSPALIRKWRLFVLDRRRAGTALRGRLDPQRARLREDPLRAGRIATTSARRRPDIQVVDVDLLGDRHLRLAAQGQERHRAGTESSRDATLRHIRNLWGYDVSLVGVDAETGATLYERSTSQIGE